MRVFHPTDLSSASDVAFVHALKLALASGGDLTVFHLARPEDADADWRDLPRVRETLVRWGLLPDGSPPAAVAGLGLDVRKVEVVGDDPVEAIVEQLEDTPADLLVLATHQHGGAARWLSRPVARPVAERAQIPALFVPPGADGFVAFDTGLVSLTRILLPADQRPPARAVLERLPALIDPLRPADTPVAVQVLHVGGQATRPHLHLPAADGWTWTPIEAQGEAAAEILRTAEREGSDLIAMATSGRHGFLDALRGSTTERVVRSARCPVLAVPAGSGA